jgi:demethylmenaquinone methyltransferase / 2-methoxy-6-polyprenyl-1,4-benzoquinol methylase
LLGANALSNLPDQKSPVEKARTIRDMFGAIAGRYDFLNHFLSANIDRRWRQICVRELGKRAAIARPKILDIGCGTADLSLAFSHLGPVIGCDFCHPMLQVGAQKIASGPRALSIALLEADALALPFASASFDIVVSAFVLRNLADMDRGLQEMRRVLRPGGFLGVLDFGLPRIPLLGALYRWYFMRILPKLGKLISGVDGPYGYLPASVQAFPPAEELQRRVERAGFAGAEYRLLTGGIAILLMGKAV